jgi:hypothetical protein
MTENELLKLRTLSGLMAGTMEIVYARKEGEFVYLTVKPEKSLFSAKKLEPPSP